jgi:hypothetical protein
LLANGAESLETASLSDEVLPSVKYFITTHIQDYYVLDFVSPLASQKTQNVKNIKTLQKMNVSNPSYKSGKAPTHTGPLDLAILKLRPRDHYQYSS